MNSQFLQKCEWAGLGSGTGKSVAGRLRLRRFFTLAEVMVAFVIIGIVFTAAVALYETNVYTNDMVTRRNAALTVARSQLDYLRSLAYSNLASSTESGIRVNEDGEVTESGAYLRTTEITAGDGTNTYKNVRVTVVCPAKARRPAVTVTLSSCIMDRSLITNMQ